MLCPTPTFHIGTQRQQQVNNFFLTTACCLRQCCVLRTVRSIVGIDSRIPRQQQMQHRSLVSFQCCFTQRYTVLSIAQFNRFQYVQHGCRVVFHGSNPCIHCLCVSLLRLLCAVLCLLLVPPYNGVQMLLVDAQLCCQCVFPVTVVVAAVVLFSFLIQQHCIFVHRVLGCLQCGFQLCNPGFHLFIQLFPLDQFWVRLGGGSLTEEY